MVIRNPKGGKMKTTTVVHCYRDTFDVYIGRYNPKFGSSKWCNPFKMGVDGDRDEVLKKFSKYIKSNKELMAALPELKGKRLGCYCKPFDGFKGKLLCHGQILAGLCDGINPQEVK